MKRIFDPVHHFIELSTAEARLLDLPAMQRLRRLRQLGLAYLAFPSAEHSRFTHALGALAIGTRAFDELVRHGRDFFGSEEDVAYQRRLVRAALLLHDVGHGPFSHACEEVLEVRHEQRTADMLALPDVAEGIAALDVDAGDVLALIVADSAGRYPELRELVSGPNLDADRMDYLLRDAYFTGVATGRYDAEQLLGSLRIVSHAGRKTVGIDRRGVVALESFVMARYMMFASVYFHHTTRMFEHVLHDVLRELWPNPRALDEVGEFLRWDDFRVLNSLDDSRSEAAYALRNRVRVYALAAEFNAERDLRAFEACEAALCERFRRSQRLGRLAVAAPASPPLGNRSALDRSGRRPERSARCARGLRRHRQAQRDGLLAQTFRTPSPRPRRRRPRSPPHLRRHFT